MTLRSKIMAFDAPVVFYEVIPPRVEAADGELQSRLDLVREVASLCDAINIPEIREETRTAARRRVLPERMEPRAFARELQRSCGVETVINRVTVHEGAAEQQKWLQDCRRTFGARNLILVGGELRDGNYPGPSVGQAAEMALREDASFLLGGICIPSREAETERVREKHRRGICFFTTQVLLDAAGICSLLGRLDGLPIRIFLSFTPISNARDLEFLQGLGAEIPEQVRQTFSAISDPAVAVEESFALARRILDEAFASLGAGPPSLGLQIERITKRNSAAARRMLAEIGSHYRALIRQRADNRVVAGARTPTRGAAAPKSYRTGELKA